MSRLTCEHLFVKRLRFIQPATVAMHRRQFDHRGQAVGSEPQCFQQSPDDLRIVGVRFRDGHECGRKLGPDCGIIW